MIDSLEGRRLFISGATRGIGLAIAIRAARDGAKVAVVGKTKAPHPKLPGTIDDACHAIEQAGGQALGITCDIRDEHAVERAVERTSAHFGGIDILVNNASAIHLAGTEETDMKRYDLMNAVNGRGTFLCTRACLSHLERSSHARVLTMSPPLDLRPEYFGDHVAYSVAKFSMSLFTLGWSRELSSRGIAANSLWPRTVIDTAAVRNLLGGAELARRGRKPTIVADAAHFIVRQPLGVTGRFFLDDEALVEAGTNSLDEYAVDPSQGLQFDLFVPESLE